MLSGDACETILVVKLMLVNPAGTSANPKTVEINVPFGVDFDTDYFDTQHCSKGPIDDFLAPSQGSQE
jgi:hypothetical protein